MSVIFGWVLAIGVPLLIVVGIIADDRAQAAHDRRMAEQRAAQPRESVPVLGVTPHNHEQGGSDG